MVSSARGVGFGAQRICGEEGQGGAEWRPQFPQLQRPDEVILGPRPPRDPSLARPARREGNQDEVSPFWARARLSEGHTGSQSSATYRVQVPEERGKECQGPLSRLEPGSPWLSANLVPFRTPCDRDGCKLENHGSCFKTPAGPLRLPAQRLGCPGNEEGVWGKGHPINPFVEVVGGPTHVCQYSLRSTASLSGIGAPVTGGASLLSFSPIPEEVRSPKLTTILGIAAFAPRRERNQSHTRSHTRWKSGRMRRGTYQQLRAQGNASELSWDAPGTGGSGGAPKCGTTNSVDPSHPGLPGAPRLGSPRAQAKGALVRRERTHALGLELRQGADLLRLTAQRPSVGPGILGASDLGKSSCGAVRGGDWTAIPGAALRARECA